MYWLNFLGLIILIFSQATYLSANNETKSTICSQNILSTWPEESVEKFNFEVLHLLDRKNNVFLLRGNLPPENDNQLEYYALTSSIKDYLENNRINIDDFKILDLSFLNYFGEHTQLETEKNWFEQYPETGSFYLYSLYGSPINPISLPESMRTFILNHYDIDGLKKLMAYLEEKMNETYDYNLVIYIHCMSGKDRTGEASACYLMQYKNFSYKKAMDLNREIARRELRTLSINAIRWYAFYLRDILNCDWIGDID